MGTLNNPAKLYGVGVGPGDPELITIKAKRLIQHGDVLTYVSNKSGHSMALQIAQKTISMRKKQAFFQYPIVIPMSINRVNTNLIYDQASVKIASYLNQNQDVVFLCEGDPFFYGSFSYVYERLYKQYAIVVVPGVNSIHAASANTGRPLALLKENVAVVSGRRRNNDILKTLKTFDNVVILKSGKRRSEILKIIRQAGRTQDGCYIEYVGFKNQLIIEDLNKLDDQPPGPYFSIFLIQSPRMYR